MLGAIIGDIVGSCYEFNSIKTTEFELFDQGSRYTDDSVMTMAVAEWLLEDPHHTHNILEEKTLKYGNLNPMSDMAARFSAGCFSLKQSSLMASVGLITVSATVRRCVSARSVGCLTHWKRRNAWRKSRPA